MTLCRQVDDAVHMMLLHHFLHLLIVADVRFHEYIVFLVLDVLQVRQIPCIRQLVQVDDAVFRILVHEEANHMAADESGPPPPVISMLRLNVVMMIDI